MYSFGESKLAGFCGCDNPDLESIESGMSIVVHCKSCGQSVATTNTRKLESMNPWLNDRTKYKVNVSPVGIEKAAFVRVIKSKVALSTQAILEVYENQRDFMIFEGGGQEFIKLCCFLKDNGITYTTSPKCSYV